MNVRIALLAALVPLVACGGGSAMKKDLDATRQNKAKMAVVSLTVSDFGRSLQFANSSEVPALIQKKMDDMLATTEASLGQHWTIVPTAGIVGNDAYQKLGKSQAMDNVFAPKPTGVAMPIFAADRGDMVKTNLDPKLAGDLCAALGVDLIAVVYSEWTTMTGGIVPTTKAYAKTVLSIYDNQGRRLFKDRKDVEGSKTLGAFGRAQVDEASLDVWVGAYKTGLETLLAKM